ncbi:DEAD/DEAH box helicase [Treponema sp.]|uniref:DEAD/DEAH box helicase n=1 Tax=Treponema sp. TaxID=166 RepID=UPI0025CEF65B|nr:DEAD/DEAH box helicase [Treponema sp.]MCR5217525.1 DEAD/DEAH box helicase [Treponema sp.]
MKFSEFTLNENLQKGIEGAGYVDCTPVQEQVLNASQQGRDLYVQSQTGTGKTAAFLISVINEMLTRSDLSAKKALIMVPTRELAVQVEEECLKLSKETGLVCASFYGGVGYDKQVALLKKGVDIIIGTPGRVIDLHEGNQMDLSSIGFLVIDEADRMFDMGFYPELSRLIKVLPSSEKRQTMLFSATLNINVKNLAWEYTRNPEEITIEAQNITVDEIDQVLLHVSSDDKMKLLLGIISRENPESLIIFSNTKKSCEIIAKRLRMNGLEAEFIIGDLPQKKRLAIMDSFKAGKTKCLVATDVAARGIDVNDLAMVINYDLPNEAENYVHRIGRTARAGKSGKAYTFCSEQDVYSLPAIERYIEKQIPSQVADSSLMAEDKSEGTYIRLDSYHEDYNDKSEFGKRRQREYEKSGRNRNRHHDRNNNGGRRDPSKGRGRYSIRNEDAKKEYKRDRRVFTEEETQALASMSTEERMKIYRQKFSKGSPAGKDKSVSSKQKNTSYRNNSSVKNKGAVKNNSVKKAKPEKKSLFGKIKSFFSKK